MGPEWGGTVDLIRILAFVVMIGIFGDVTISVFNGFGQPYRITQVEIVQSSIVISAAWFLMSHVGLTGAALAWLPAILISQIMSAYFLRDILDHPMYGLLKPYMAIIASTGICVAVSLLTIYFIPGIAGLIVAVILGMFSTLLLLWFADRFYGLGFTRDLTMIFPQLAELIGIPSVEGK
jgi:O-antigen/teichoic acid export membrane protein